MPALPLPVDDVADTDRPAAIGRATPLNRSLTNQCGPRVSTCERGTPPPSPTTGSRFAHFFKNGATLVHGVAYTTAEIETKIVALEAGLARSELRVEYSDRSVTYRSVAEQIDALNYFKRLLSDLQAELTGSRRSRQLSAVASRGL